MQSDEKLEVLIENDERQVEEAVKKKSTKRKRCKRLMKNNWLSVSVFISLLIGVGVGVVLRNVNPNPLVLDLFSLIGEIFIRGIFMLIAPLIVTSVISGIVESKNTDLKKVGIIVSVYCLTTSLIAASTGVIMHYVSVPILPTEMNLSIQTNRISNHSDDTGVILMDILRNMVPNNIVRAFFQISKTTVYNLDGRREETTEYIDSVNMCGIIVFSLLLGLTLRISNKKYDCLTEMVGQLNSVFIDVLNYIMYCAPVGVLCLVAAKIGSSGVGAEIWTGTIIVFSINSCGVVIHAMVTLNIIYFVFTRQNPFRYTVALKDALLTAAATMSSAATLPTTMRCAEEYGIRPSFTRIVLPIAATINMDGGAMLNAQASLFLAHVHGVPITLGKLLLIIFMAMVNSIGAAAVPGSFIATLMITLATAGIPSYYAPMFVGMDFIFDRFRTACNVYGDCVGVAIVQRLTTKNNKIVIQ